MSNVLRREAVEMGRKITHGTEVEGHAKASLNHRKQGQDWQDCDLGHLAFPIC